MNIHLCFIVTIFVVAVQSLKCRTREHMKQQQDFYNLASNCMKSSMNVMHQTPMSTATGSGSSWGEHRQQQQNVNNRNQDRNRNNYDGGSGNTYESNSSQDHRYDRNKMNYGGNTNDSRYQRRFKERRDTVAVQKFNRKNSTTTGSKNKSPLEEIGSCVIHCIFREMKMLNNENKADRMAMTNVMTSRIRDSELKEFIQDSIEECFDIMDTEQLITDNNEEHCDFSKKLILCLEEKAKRGCEDWEIRDNSTQPDFNFNKEDEDRATNDNRNTNQNGYFNSNNKFNGRYPNFNMGQRRT
ncbi:odorant-binding protein 59a isoform X2 [Planococcus citri]|uniref:odorant-binding protein 59a isoform X2 n=1 Tax=Planococcus citri TaxID=170843 RepID=UPI0031F95542